MAGLRPFRFSVQAAYARSRADWLETARRAEGQGFDMILTADHLGGCAGPLTALAAAAAVTDRLRLGVMVLNNDFHHPSLLARDAATVDVLSDGRLELGLGAGHAGQEYARAGIAFEPARVRVDRLAEAVDVLRRLLDGEAVTFSGAHYRLAEERCLPRPVQGHLPLLVGGAGRRVHALAAQRADAVGFTGLGALRPDGLTAEPSGWPAVEVTRAVDHVRESAGDRLADLELQVLVQGVVVTDRPHERADAFAAGSLVGLSSADILTTPYLMMGTVDGIVDKLVADRERWGFSHYTVRTDAMTAMEPVIARLSGR